MADDRSGTAEREADVPRREPWDGPAGRSPNQPTEISSRTGFAPSLPETMPSPRPKTTLDRGERIADFEIVQVLGRGAFGAVYLARQLSLDRQVALKVTPNLGSEGRTMARLEHDHIVPVYSETVEQNQRLLCMQYVPGLSLAEVIDRLKERHGQTWTGRDFLHIIDEALSDRAAFDAAAFRDRHTLEESDRLEAICWIGARLADALAHAHRHGVVHRDIKPANTLISQYGRPLLADFNLALQPIDLAQAGDSLFGGTLGYMAPEHLDAFNPHVATTPEVVDARCDIYSLGVLLYELATGRLPFEGVSREGSQEVILRRIMEQRRLGPPPLCCTLPSPAWRVLNHVIQHCLRPHPDERYQSAADLAAALDGCRELRQAERELPDKRMKTLAARWPFLALAILGLAPHALGSVVNISYNRLRIVEELTPSQQQVFLALVLAYNLLAYPACVWGCCAIVLPVYRAWRELRHSTYIASEDVDDARHRALTFPGWAVFFACCGWLPGAFLFPLVLHLTKGPISAAVFGHFVISFTMSGFIALTYSFLGVQCLVVCVYYPRLWSEVRALRQTATRELRIATRRLRLFPVLAGTIPLAGALLMIGIGPQHPEDRAFQLLVAALIVLGMIGFQIAVIVTGLLSRNLTVLTGRDV